MSKPYAYISIKRLQTSSLLSQSYNHNYRKVGFRENVDTSLSHLNQEVVPLDGDNYNDAFKRRQERDGFIIPRSDSTRILEIISTYSGGKVDDTFNVNRWVDENIKWYNKTFGEENIMSAVLHLDETTPHLHVMVIPVVDGKLNATTLTLSTREMFAKTGKKGYALLQDSYAEAMKPLGLSRGIVNSRATHVEMRKFREAFGEYLNKRLPDIIEGESVERYKARADTVHEMTLIDAFKQEKVREREFVELQGEADEIKKENKVQKIKINKLEAFIKDLDIPKLKRKAKRMDQLLYAIENKIPDEERANRIFEEMQEIAEIAEYEMKRKNMGDGEK